MLALGLICSVPVPGQLAKSAYRALGQPDLRQNGVNMVEGLEMYNPLGVATDVRDGTMHLYVSDTQNHRVLAWQDIRSYQRADPPSLILGQSGPQSSAAYGIGAKGFNLPIGMAVDPSNGNLYVADFGNHRVLRFPNPFQNVSRVEPDAVYGQPNFNVTSANANGASRSSLNRPRGLGFDSQGNLWIADTGDHRVLRYSAPTLDGLNPEADLVIGQPDFSANKANRGGAGVSASGFDTPVALAFDRQNNLFVSDYSNARVLKFNGPLNGDANASAVFGQSSFNTRGVPAQASAATMSGPTGLCVDAAGNLYVAIPLDNRVLVFAPGAASGSPARDLIGQVDFTSTQANPSSFPYASGSAFSNVSDVKVDGDGNLTLADTGNNRVLLFPKGSKSAAQVWGQLDFKSNGVNRIKPGSINSPYKIVIDYSQAPYALYVSDTNNHRILGWRDAVRFRTGDPADLVIGQPGFDTALANVDTRGSQNPSQISLSQPKGIAVDRDGNLYAADSGNNRVLRYPRPVAQSGRITPDLVLGQANFTSSVSAAVSSSSLNAPTGLALDSDGNLFVADAGNNRVMQFSAGVANNGAAIRVFGQPGFRTGMPSNLPSAQTLTAPQGIYVDAAYSLYVADSGANRVMIFPNTRDAAQAGTAAALVLGQERFDAALAGGGASGLRVPWDVALDSNGNMYVSDANNNRVLIYPSLIFLPLAGAAASDVLGQKDTSGSGANFNTGQAMPEGLASPRGVFIDRRDTLYIGDAGNNRVVHFLKPSSVAHAANTQSGAPLALGGMATFFGSELAESEEKAGTGMLPLSLAGREIAINDDLAVPLSSVSATRIDFQVPSQSPTGSARVAVRVHDTGELVAGTTVPLSTISPGLFTDDPVAKGQGRILNQDGSANSPSNAALRGTAIKIFGTGQGPVSPAVPDGQAAPADVSTIAVPTSDGAACLNRQPSVCVAIGNTFGEVQFSGLAPQLVGVWQLTVKIPANATTGTVPLRALINGAPSNLVSVSIK